VHFQTPTGPRGANTADFLVGGEKGTGVGGVPFDVYTPATTNPNNVILGIIAKNDQAPNIIVNLRHTTVTPEQLGDVISRINNFGPNSAGNIKSVRIIK
jgi:hypothetical protein